MSYSNVFALHGFSLACGNCQLQNLCRPIGVRKYEMTGPNRIVIQRRTLDRGETLFNQGDCFRSLFVVRSGLVKCASLAEDGWSHVTAFHIPGEILGLDAISEGRHSTSAIALEDAVVCELPFEHLQAFAHKQEGILHQLLRVMSRELAAEDRFARIIANRSAEERLAGFLLDIATRYGMRGYSCAELRLSMTRTDISNYLGLAIETVSRLFARFQREGIIATEGKAVKLLQSEALAKVAGIAVAFGNKPIGHDRQG